MNNQILSRADLLIQALKPDIVDWLVALGTLAAVIVALIIAIWGDRLKVHSKVSIKAVKIVQNSQTYASENKLIIYRLIIKNIGKILAKGVRCNLEGINEGNGGQFHPRENFISIPLNWTHFGINRNIAINEEAYIDTVQIKLGQDAEHFFRICWPKELGFPDEPAISRLSFDHDYILRLAFYSEKLIKRIDIRLNRNFSASIDNELRSII
ncbi:MAG: hypothetical protein AAB793_01610 [Patescibacteria group bacterium]